MRRGRVEYSELVENALRGVVREVLHRLAAGEIGPPHHYYITFRTAHAGVEMPDFLRERYSTEITIVLQHEYWDLEVDETAFSVTLSFSDVPARLTVPFEAVRVFADPSAEFGLQFSTEEERPTGEASEPLSLPVKDSTEQPAEEHGESGDSGAGAEIVTLDRFRKR